MEFHKRRYIKLAVTLFSLSFLFNAWQFIVGWDSAVGDIAVSPVTGMLMLFISASMAFMGAFYLLRK